MKKSLLTTAISTAMISAGAYAAPSAVQLTLAGGPDIVLACPPGIITSTTPPDPTFTYGALTVLTPSNATMNGELCLDLSPNIPSMVALNFVSLAGPVGAGGTVFTSGEIRIWTDWGSSGGWIYYGAVDASVTNITCLGIKSGPTFPGGTSTPACSMTLLNTQADIYMQ